MELRVLRYFLMVAREENITKAAALLNVTQPTLSRQLMQLEDELGVKLFHRGKYSITLTEDGMLLRRRAQELISLSDKTVEELTHSNEVLSGEIAVGSGETSGMGFIAEKMRLFQEEHPKVRFSVFSGIADEIKEKLEKGLLDIGVLSEPVDITRYEFIRLPLKEKWALLTRQDSPLAQKEYVTPQDLIDTPLIMVRRELVRNELASWFGPAFDKLDIRATCDLLFNYATMIRSGVGSALTLDIGAIYDDLVSIPLQPAMETGLVLVWKKNQLLPESARRFIEYVKSTI